MPQPLRKWGPIRFAHDAVKERPDLAAGIAEVCAAWTDVEIHLGILLAVILDTEARTGVTMYLALTGSQAQIHAFNGAAEARLPTSLQPELDTILQEMRNRGAERNRVVHALWGVSDDHPDALIRCPPESIVRDLATSYQLYLVTGKKVEEPPQTFIDELTVYKANDFRDIVQRIDGFSRQIIDFSHRVGAAHVERHLLASALMRSPPADEGGPPQEETHTTPPESV
jgi:hypothetical protein